MSEVSTFGKGTTNETVDELLLAATHLEHSLNHLRMALNQEAEQWRERLHILQAETESVLERTKQTITEREKERVKA